MDIYTQVKDQSQSSHYTVLYTVTIANIKSKVGLTFPFFFSTSDTAPVHLNVHSTFNMWHRSHPTYSSNSMFRFENTRILSKKYLAPSLVLKKPQTSSL